MEVPYGSDPPLIQINYNKISQTICVPLKSRILSLVVRA